MREILSHLYSKSTSLVQSLNILPWKIIKRGWTVEWLRVYLYWKQGLGMRLQKSRHNVASLRGKLNNGSQSHQNPAVWNLWMLLHMVPCADMIWLRTWWRGDYFILAALTLNAIISIFMRSRGQSYYTGRIVWSPQFCGNLLQQLKGANTS